MSCSNNQQRVKIAKQTLSNSTDSVSFKLTEFSFPNTSIRAIEVVNDSTVWFAGSNGFWGYTQDNGANWHTQQFTIDSIIPEFRSISVTKSGAIFLVSIVEPAAIFKSSDMGEHWDMVYTDTNTNAFFDAIDFWDTQNGILLGDAINGCFHVALTTDGGDSWKRVACENLPVALSGENPYAASNTNISTSDSNAWFGTGGTNQSRVFHTSNYGKSWQVNSTPIVAGKKMTGIYSVHFTDNQTGLVAGGNWEEVTDTTSTFAITHDGGGSWMKISNSIGFISCIQFLPNSQTEIFALRGRARGGNSVMAYSPDSGTTWQTFPNSNYLAIQFASPKKAWVSGNEKIARVDFK
tara:strand:- start:122506 stop:123555 length:1050 start_codon:yes stop_codon:yes gene_type:complete